ncbi:hypothetical protein QBC34DRAFT_404805 [Podospora aff. communis PSN243]|uniref:Uncharacterized protein n=1 Tax=Podospora aff. communis PSN243 TaxID=3040156 RepID=A0AAV9GPQ4_9PEZI|nr:hypothetical protein QBC34DRAFT_404805 [Podospora aff. communis PSN243]
MDGEPPRRVEGVERKGKGKAVDEQQEDLNQAGTQRDGGKSMLTRVAESATSLPTAIFGSGLGAGEIPQLGTGEKGTSSRSAEAINRLGETSAAALFGASSSGASAALRSGQTKEHIAKEEAAFSTFLDSTNPQSLVPEEPEEAWHESAPIHTSQSGRERPSQSVADQEKMDGANVVALLATAVEAEPDIGLRELNSEDDLSGLRKALFGDGSTDTTSSVAWDNVLNFIPRYLQGSGVSNSAAADMSTHLGAVGRDEAWEAWIGQWSRVLTGYQDEVWGDFGSLIDEARAEVQRLKAVEPNEKPPQPTALLRLRAILGHLRGDGSP